MPANLLDATGNRIAWFHSNDYRGDSTPEDAANAAFVLELRNRLAEVYDYFFVGDPGERSLNDYRACEERMRETLRRAGVLAAVETG